MTEDSNDDDQQLQMALQMSLDEISMTRSRDLSKSEEEDEDYEETIVLPKIVQEIAKNTKTDIPIVLPKYNFFKSFRKKCFKYFYYYSRCSGIKLDDGVFKVGDLHKNSYYLDFSEDIYSRMDGKNLRRSLSFGDLLSRRDLYKNNRRFVIRDE